MLGRWKTKLSIRSNPSQKVQLLDKLWTETWRIHGLVKALIVRLRKETVMRNLKLLVVLSILVTGFAVTLGFGNHPTRPRRRRIDYRS
jgi:hypothetical protein